MNPITPLYPTLLVAAGSHPPAVTVLPGTEARMRVHPAWAVTGRTVARATPVVLAGADGDAAHVTVSDMSAHRAARARLDLAALVVLGRVGGMSLMHVSTVVPSGHMRLDAQGKGVKGMRPMPLTARTVLAISDAKLRVRVRLAADGELCDDDIEALLLLDHANYVASKADLARRKATLVEETGEVSPWIAREERELERDYAFLAAA